MTCKDCTKRTPTCHIDCEDYAEQKKQYEAIREARRIDNLSSSQNILDGLKSQDNIIKIKKRRGGYQ